jgi:hypothetical protein
MHIEFGGEAFGQQLFRRQRRKCEVTKMDCRERANIGKICMCIILAERFKRKRPLQISGLIL